MLSRFHDYGAEELDRRHNAALGTDALRALISMRFLGFRTLPDFQTASRLCGLPKHLPADCRQADRWHRDGLSEDQGIAELHLFFPAV
jgi:hypothetical protein